MLIEFCKKKMSRPKVNIFVNNLGQVLSNQDNLVVVVVTETLSIDVVFLTGDREQHSNDFTSLLNLCPENINVLIVI